MVAASIPVEDESVYLGMQLPLSVLPANRDYFMVPFHAYARLFAIQELPYNSIDAAMQSEGIPTGPLSGWFDYFDTNAAFRDRNGMHYMLPWQQGNLTLNYILPSPFEIKAGESSELWLIRELPGKAQVELVEVSRSDFVAELSAIGAYIRRTPTMLQEDQHLMTDYIESVLPHLTQTR